MNGGIVGDAEKLGENFLANFFGEGLSLFFVALAMAFEAMAEDFVEKNGGSASAEKRGTVVRLGDGRLAEILQVFRHFIDFGGELGFAGKTAGGRRLKRFDAQELHAIVGARLCLENQAGGRIWGGDRRALTGDHAHRGSLHLKYHTGEVNAGIFSERGGEAANLAFPGDAIEGRRLRRLTGVNLRCSLGEIRRAIFFFGAHGGVGLDVEKSGRGAFVFAIGKLP